MKYATCTICHQSWGVSAKGPTTTPYICPRCEIIATRRQKTAREIKATKIYLMRLCVIVNAIITALITFIVATMFVFVGYVAHDGVTVAEFFPIIVTVLVVPVMLWEVERRYLIG